MHCDMRKSERQGRANRKMGYYRNGGKREGGVN